MTASLLSLGIVPTKRPFGLDVAHGGLVGLAVLGLLGPASGAGDDGPAWPCEELVLSLQEALFRTNEFYEKYLNSISHLNP